MRIGLASDHGFVLIVVIWTAALLAMLTFSFSRTSQSYLRSAVVNIEAAKAEALADTGFSFAVLDWAEARKGSVRPQRFKPDGTPTVCAADSGDILLIRVQDTGGRININLAGDKLLQALFAGLGSDLDTAARYADTLIDYRDRDDDRRPRGAEAPEYRAAGRETGPKNAPLDNLDELNQVLGFEPDLIAAMLPHVTIHSASAGLDPRVTRPELVEIVGRGQARALQIPMSTSVQRLPAEFTIASDQRTFAVHSEARLATGAVFVRDAVVEFAANRASSYRIRTWQRGRSPLKASRVPIDPFPQTPC